MNEDAAGWIAAERAEIANHQKNQSWTMIDRSELPEGRSLVRLIWVYKRKRNGTMKARLYMVAPPCGPLLFEPSLRSRRVLACSCADGISSLRTSKANCRTGKLSTATRRQVTRQPALTAGPESAE
eukprot:5865815-Pleurochrysis_carterae.AAC.2